MVSFLYSLGELYLLTYGDQLFATYFLQIFVERRAFTVGD